MQGELLSPFLLQDLDGDGEQDAAVLYTTAQSSNVCIAFLQSLAGSAAASDAFFPFRDGLDVIVDQGATCVIQPGGSIRDDEVIAAADERGIVMVFTGERHFRH